MAYICADGIGLGTFVSIHKYIECTVICPGNDMMPVCIGNRRQI